MTRLEGIGKSGYLQVDRKHSPCDLPLNWKYRSHFEIIALMLESVRDADATGFSMMTYANTNSRQLGRYLHVLRKLGFINVVVGKNQILYRASKSGIEFLRQYYILLGMLLGPPVRDRPAAECVTTSDASGLMASRRM